MAKGQDDSHTLAVISFVFSLIFFLPVFPVIGAILGAVAFYKIPKGREGRGLALAAMVIGVAMTILQIALFLLMMYLFQSLAGIFSGLSSQNGMDACISKSPGVGRDMCIFMTLMMNANQTGQYDQGLCDKYVGDADIRSMCNAMLKNDKSYCSGISDADNRIKCMGLVDEMEIRRNQTASD